MFCRSYGLPLFVCLYGLGRFGTRGLSCGVTFVGRSVLAFFAGLSYVVSEDSARVGVDNGLLFWRESLSDIKSSLSSIYSCSLLSSVGCSCSTWYISMYVWSSTF